MSLESPSRREFAQAAKIRYETVKYPHQPPWEGLSDADRQLWVEVQVESYKALRVALATGEVL